MVVMDRPAIALFALASTVVCAVPAAGESMDAAKRRDIQEILRIERWNPGPDKLPQFLRALRDHAYPQVPEPDWAEAERAAAEVADPTERMIALHDRLYTADEIRQMLAFYRSPLGQKLLQGSALTTTEGFVGKQEYLVEVGQHIGSVLRKRGYEPREGGAPPAARGERLLTIDENGRVTRGPRIVQPIE